ncbi:hypothetical protein EXIGLDRAFT_599478 [Exidia glandulosa HHB12029]|uniref:Histone-lysine N-methyltransferase SET5 n=1 Tax=Exidia glandulosa HHB12029 TaxID=1314781 RepID=A0A166BSX2_EXIGL|nr:hypothetical protein EXIGLDRAFT_599478 [Exidia glandulosa HHB12029]
MNVVVKQVPMGESQGTRVMKNVLVATKDFNVGEVIYTELPMAAALDVDLEGTGKYCSQCFRALTGSVVRIPDDPLKSAYCSEECRDLAAYQHHSFAFGIGSLIPQEPTPPPPAPRRAAQNAFAELVRSTGRLRPLLTLRLFAHQVMSETYKLLAGVTPAPPSGLPEADTSDYTFADHVERLRFLELEAPVEEHVAMRAVFATALNTDDPAEVVTDERYDMLKGKVGYNAIGVAFGNGREDRPSKAPGLSPGGGEENKLDYEWTRTPLGTDRQVGAALYRVSSYLGHSCTPSTRPTFPKGTYELHLVASRSIMKGDELTMAYVNVDRRSDDVSAKQCLLRRCAQLAAGWRFLCKCERCLQESPTRGKDAEAVEDGAKVEDAVKRFEDAAAA